MLAYMIYRQYNTLLFHSARVLIWTPACKHVSKAAVARHATLRPSLHVLWHGYSLKGNKTENLKIAAVLPVIACHFRALGSNQIRVKPSGQGLQGLLQEFWILLVSLFCQTLGIPQMSFGNYFAHHGGVGLSLGRTPPLFVALPATKPFCWLPPWLVVPEKFHGKIFKPPSEQRCWLCKWLSQRTLNEVYSPDIWRKQQLLNQGRIPNGPASFTTLHPFGMFQWEWCAITICEHHQW